ncbi:MAG: CotH kinase family protein [Bacteroidota bacterium]
MAKTYFAIFPFVLIALFVNPVISQNDFYDINSVKEIRITFKEHNWDHLLDSLFLNVGEDGRLKGEVTIDGKTFHNIGVRYKGYSSWDVSQVKSPFNIDLEYSLNEQNYQGYTKIKLSNVIHDPSFVREVLSYEIARKYMPASKANYAFVYVNDTLIGLYTNVEAVDKNFTDDRFLSRKNSFFKGSPENLEYPFGQNANLAYTHGTDTTGYKPYYKKESDNEPAWPDLLNLIYTLNNDTANIDRVINIDRTLWMHAFNYTLVNLDSYIGFSQNYYLYKDDNGRFNPIVWDLNMSFGSFRESDGTSLYLSITKVKELNPLKILTSSPYTPKPLIKNLLLNSTYKRMFLAHMRTIINENFKNNFYYTRGQELQSIIGSYVLADTNKFYSYDDFINNMDTITGPAADQYPGLKDLMEARIAYLDTFPGFAGAPVITDISHEPEYPEKGNDTWITAKISGANDIFLAYRFKSSGIYYETPMYDDGSHHDGTAGDSIYGASFILTGNTVQYYIYAQNDSAGIFSPERAGYEFYSIQPRIYPGNIVINEFMAENTNTIADQEGEYDTWIELFNTTQENINLKTLYLSDDTEIPSKWAFPDTSIQAKSFINVWVDNDVSQTGLHANFRLSENAGQIILYCENNTYIDSVTYSLQLAEKTYGRYPNGYGSFVYMLPTFGKHNYVGTTPLSGFLLYPNPANNIIYVEFPSKENFLSLEITDMKGSIVKSRKNFADSGSNESGILPVDVSQFQKGIYFFKIVTENNVNTKKFVIY